MSTNNSPRGNFHFICTDRIDSTTVQNVTYQLKASSMEFHWFTSIKCLNVSQALLFSVMPNTLPEQL